jgi:anthranilate synthase/aminodeoxychorismate synthase-like glutamine amidotransferase
VTNPKEKKLSVLFIDNFDSFVFNLVDEFERRGCDVSVWRNDIPSEKALEIASALPAPRLVVISPGPGRPEQAGCSLDLIKNAPADLPIFGVCLGHQAIIEAFGGKIERAAEIMHGKTSYISHDGSGLFADLPCPLPAGRYHSLAGKLIPRELRVTAWLGNIPMAIEHNDRPVAGVQFHPESILTPHGGRIIENVIRWAASR